MPYKQAPGDNTCHPSWRIRNLRRRVERARNAALVSCPASRHLHTMADSLMQYGEYSMLSEEPAHCAGSMYAVLESLWKARRELAELKAQQRTEEA